MATAAFVFSACKKDDPVTPNTPGPRDYSVSVNGKIVTVNNLDADSIIGIGAQGPYGANKYTFFSLANNSRVSSSDSASSNWDIAFRGTKILVNSGTSGPGTGGGFVYVGAFDAVTSVPADSTIKTDNAPASYAITYGSGNGWYSYDGVNVLVTPIPGRTLIIKTANGKYAKVQILNYYRGGATPATTATDSVKAFDSRYYTFRYTYQPDGTMNF